MKEHIFKTINDQNTAYWIGFLAADGSCSSYREDQLEIGLAARDKEHLEKFAHFINCPISSIIEYKAKCSNNGKFYPSAKITVYSKIMRQDLQQYGILPSKSNCNINFLKNIPEDYKLSFIMGYFDGDGWYTNAKTFNFGFCGNEKTMSSIIQYLNDKYDISCSLFSYKKSPNTFYFQSSSKQKILQFIELYLSLENKCDLLERKKEVSYELQERLMATQQPVEKTKYLISKICLYCGNSYTTSHNEQKYCSYDCSYKAAQKAERPSREKLKFLIRNYSFLQIGRKYGVSDNTIRKWCKAVNLPNKAAEIKQYTNEQWNNI